MTQQTYSNPLKAPDAPKPVYRNIVRITKNEIGDMPLARKQAENPPIPADVYTPFWMVEGECLDAAFSNGDAFPWRFSTKLLDKNGKDMDKRQRPFVFAQAAAGAGVIVFPEDSEYDESKVIGNVFLTQTVDPDFGKRYSVIIEELGADYTYEGEVRIVPTREERANATPTVTTTGAATTTTELSSDTDAMSAFLQVLDGVDADADAVANALLDSNAGTGATLKGSAVNGLALNGTLLDQLVDNGFAEIVDGKVQVS